jgi:hypothetical protein
MQRAGAVAAARMLLWSKALALASGDPAAVNAQSCVDDSRPGL